MKTVPPLHAEYELVRGAQRLTTGVNTTQHPVPGFPNRSGTRLSR